MKNYVLSVPRLLNSLDTGKVLVEAENPEQAIEKLFVILPPGKGLQVSEITVEERTPSPTVLFFGLVLELETLNTHWNGGEGE
jgi:hypothetical protein